QRILQHPDPGTLIDAHDPSRSFPIRSELRRCHGPAGEAVACPLSVEPPEAFRRACGRCATVTSALTPGRPFGSGTAVPTGGDCAGLFCRQMLNVFLVSQAPRSRCEPRMVRSSLRGYLAVEPFFLAGASSWLVSIGAVVLRTSSANFRWLASTCSASARALLLAPCNAAAP